MDEESDQFEVARTHCVVQGGYPLVVGPTGVLDLGYDLLDEVKLPLQGSVE